MSPEDRRTHVEIDVNGRVVATADVEHDQPGVVRATLHVEPGHQPIGSRTRLVDAVLDLPEVQDQQRLEAALPLGDSEMLNRLRERCDDVEAHAAGATALVDAHPPKTKSPSQPPRNPGHDHGRRQHRELMVSGAAGVRLRCLIRRW